ncbi:MAG: diguanylate cyclase [Oscillospiraceae bacterium]|jgi:EAL and modified HD-GYP domain-containing signal transduction protein|nr:diguanylate cyclase [Oscillospiraceae bacterium]
MSFSDIIEKAHQATDRALRKFSRKADFRSVLGDISGILDPHDMEIIVTRGRGCEIIFTNARAEERLYNEQGDSFTCKAVFSKHFPGLCDNCPYGGKTNTADGTSFEIDDSDGRTFTVRRNTIKWADGKPATIFMMRDITSQIEANKRLYNLAYIDQLTNVPNRQRLKEDFVEIEEKISAGEISGILALFDLDNFKTVNDTYGHNTGDVVLRRLTEYLQESPHFAGKIYRLGGDEFIVVMSNATTRFDFIDELKHHYKGVLSTALRAYTLPNIDVKCTLSIGVSIFPKHGTNLTDLLRKADISLYQAKAAGRNQICYFEDQYDTAQKFKDMFINIQPVLLGVGKTFGYELVDRSQGNDNEDDGTVILNEFNRTLDALGLDDIENNLHYFISYTKKLLSPTVLRNIPRDKFIVQISISKNPTKPVIQHNLTILNELRDKGYKLAISGMDSASPVLELLNIVDYCKFAASDRNHIKQKTIIARNQRVKFIAVNIDTTEDFIKAKETGYHMYQGYYFNQPIIEKKTKEISPLKVNYFRLMKLSITDDYMDFKEISSIISSDVALSYKLLRILNSAAVGLRNVASIENAVAYIGEEALKKWIAVLALRGIAEDKPLELVRMSLVRARFGELLAPTFRIKRNPQHVFMVGMLSLLHIALEMSKEQLLEDIPIADEIAASLLTRTGIYSDLLRFYENYEYANWDAVSQFVEENHLDSSMVSDAYIAAVKWYNDLTAT